MAQWKLFRERRQRMRRALQLLVVSGVIRPADMDVPYFRAEDSIGQNPPEGLLL